MNYFRDQGPLLLVNGYRIVKIAGRGKNPIENSWTKKVVTKEDCENDNAADRSVGIICGEDVMCVDADIYEHELADRIMAVIRKLHPDALYRLVTEHAPSLQCFSCNVDNLAPTRSPMYTKGEGDERVTWRRLSSEARTSSLLLSAYIRPQARSMNGKMGLLNFYR